MPNYSTRLAVAAPFATAAASAARGDLVEILDGSVSVEIDRLGADVVYDLRVSCEAPIELHSHAASLIIIPVRVIAEQSAAHFPNFEGSLELANTGGRAFEVVLEGDFEERRSGIGERAAFSVRMEDVLEALLRLLGDRIETHVRTVESTTGIPL